MKLVALRSVLCLHGKTSLVPPVPTMTTSKVLRMPVGHTPRRAVSGGLRLYLKA